MSVPESYKNEKKLRQVFGEGIRRIWITSDCKELDEKVNERDKMAYRLEQDETRLIRSANAARLKAMRKSKDVTELCEDCESIEPVWSRQAKRPTRRANFFGKKVDSIQFYRSRLAVAIQEIEGLQRKHRERDVKLLSAVFIEFESQSAAQVALQTLSHHQPLHMTPRFTGIAPKEVIWSSLNLSWWQRIIRKFMIQGALAALIIFWSVPAAIVGTISNITYLANTVPFLHWLLDLPDVLKGVIAGLLPSAALVLLMSLVPIICRSKSLAGSQIARADRSIVLARKAGLPSLSHVELFTQSAHFCFQVVQVFLVTTITSAASAAVGQIIQDPLSAKDLLAQNLPKASNFYISYFLLQGLSMSSIAVVQIAGALVFKLLAMFFASTPRRLFKRWTQLTGLSWGNVFPVFTNMGVIALTYSCIAPVILAFAFIGLFLVYQAYRYNLMFVYYIDIDTKGLVFPRALQHLLTGIYLAEICMIGLFSVKAAIGPLIIMAMFAILTILAHISLNEALSPLMTFLPRSLDTEEEEIQANADAEAAYIHAITRRGRVWKWFHPNLYKDYADLRRKVRRDIVRIQYSEKELEDAYYEPGITSPTPRLWIPRDAGGVSEQEIRQTSDIIPISNQGAHLDDKNKIQWDKYDADLPMWETKILY
jgi:hypothetical protein